MRNTENLIPFSKENPAKNPGRKPDKLKWLTKEHELSSADIRRLLSYILVLTQDEIDKLIKDKTASILEVSVAKLLKNGARVGSPQALDRILDRVVGKVPLPIEGEMTSVIKIKPPIKPGGDKKE